MVFATGVSLPQVLKEYVYGLVLDFCSTNPNVVCIRGSGLRGQEIRGHHVLHDVKNAKIDNAYAIGFFEGSLVAQQALHHVRQRHLTSYKCRRYTLYPALFDYVC